MSILEKERKEAVRRYLSGDSIEYICKDLRKSERWLYKWIRRYKSGNPEWFKNKSRAPNNIPHKTPNHIEETVIEIRHKLKDNGGFYGPLSIQWEMEDIGYNYIPHENTIKNILRRNGEVEQEIVSKHYKPRGIPYPKIEAKGRVNLLHEMDYLGPRYLDGGYRFYSLNIMDVGTHRVTVNITEDQRGVTAVEKLILSWKKLGVPQYLKTDNEVCFRGSNKHPRAFGKVIRLCLNLGVEPIFIPLSEPWRNGCIEKFQDTCQKMFLRKYFFKDTKELKKMADSFEKRHNEKYRYSYLRGKTPLQSIKSSGDKIKKLSDKFQMPTLEERPNKGFIHVIRFIRSDKILQIFGEKFTVPEKTVHSYIKATIDVQREKLSLFLQNKLIKEINYSYKILKK
jgi:putative transposase